MKSISVRISDFPDSLGGKLRDVMFLFDNLDPETRYDETNRNRLDRFPLKTEDVMFVQVLQGECTLTVNLEEVTVKAGQVLGIMPNSVFLGTSHSDDWLFCCFSMSSDMYATLLNTIGVYVGLSERYARYFVIDVDEVVMQETMTMYRLMKKELLEPDYPTKKMVMERYCQIMLLKCIHRLDPQKPREQPEVAPSRRIQIYREFLALLEKHFREEKSIAFYAEQMCLTPKYLSMVVKKVSGKHGSQWIEEYVALEAKALLRQGNRNIKQVSDMLNFPSQSIFGRFFKKMTGYSPKEYKQL